MQAIQESLQLSLPQYVHITFRLYRRLTRPISLDGWVGHVFEQRNAAILIINFLFVDRKVG